MIECIRWWTVHYPELVQVWAVLAILDLTLFMLALCIPEGEEQGFESASAVGVVDQLREEM